MFLVGSIHSRIYWIFLLGLSQKAPISILIYLFVYLHLWSSCPVGQRYSLFASTLNTPAIRFKTIGGSSAGMVIGGTTSGVKYLLIEVHYVSASTTPDFNTGVDVQYILTT